MSKLSDPALTLSQPRQSVASKMGLQPESKHFSGWVRTSLPGGCTHSTYFGNVYFHLRSYSMHAWPQPLPPSASRCVVTCYHSPAKKRQPERIFTSLLKVIPLKSDLDLKRDNYKVCGLCFIKIRCYSFLSFICSLKLALLRSRKQRN